MKLAGRKEFVQTLFPRILKWPDSVSHSALQATLARTSDSPAYAESISRRMDTCELSRHTTCRRGIVTHHVPLGRCSMTCLQAFGSLQPHCHPESAAARLRPASGAAAGPSSARLQHCCGRQNAPAAGALSSTSSGRAAQHVSTVAAVMSSDCSTAAPAEQPAWERLEALYTSDHYPLVAPGLLRPGLPLHVDSRALQQLLRPVGGLLHLAVQLEEKPPSQLQREDEERRKRQDYYANVGDAIRTLREETPLLFWRDLTCGGSKPAAQ